MDTNTLNDHAADLLSALQDDRKISALKAIRAITGSGLMEAKTVLDMFQRAYGKTPKPYQPTFESSLAVEEPLPEYIVSVRDDFEEYSHTFYYESEAMEYAEGRRNTHVTVGRVIAKTVPTTTYTLKRV